MRIALILTSIIIVAANGCKRTPSQIVGTPLAADIVDTWNAHRSSDPMINRDMRNEAVRNEIFKKWDEMSSADQDSFVAWGIGSAKNAVLDSEFAFEVQWALVAVAARNRDVRHLAAILPALSHDVYHYHPLESVIVSEAGPEPGITLLLDVAQELESRGGASSVALNAAQRALANVMSNTSSASSTRLREYLRTEGGALIVDPTYDERRRQWDGSGQPPLGILMNRQGRD